MSLEFKRLTEVEKSDITDLMNNELVRKHMPLLTDEFTEEDCEKFVATKEKHWSDFGFGLWAFMVDNQFAGWGGIQYENSEADLALVLHPKYWGFGKAIYREIINKAFHESGVKSVTVLFPPTRTRVAGLLQLGFEEDGELEINNEPFIRYRLNNPAELN